MTRCDFITAPRAASGLAARPHLMCRDLQRDILLLSLPGDSCESVEPQAVPRAPRSVDSPESALPNGDPKLQLNTAERRRLDPKWIEAHRKPMRMKEAESWRLDPKRIEAHRKPMRTDEANLRVRTPKFEIEPKRKR